MGENRYLFITAAFEAKLLVEPPEPGNTAFLHKEQEEWTDSDRSNKEMQDEHDQWQEKLTRGSELAENLNNRFAAWYYVISSDSFEKVRLGRSDLIKEKETMAL